MKILYSPFYFFRFCVVLNVSFLYKALDIYEEKGNGQGAQRDKDCISLLLQFGF